MDNLIKTSKRFLYILLITAAISVTGFSLPPLILLILPLGLIVGVAAAFFALRAPFKVEALRKQGELVYVLGIKRWLLFTPLVASIVFVIAAILFNQLPSTPYCILNYADFTTFATKLSWAKYIAIAVGISGLAILAVSLFISLILFISSRKKHQEDKVATLTLLVLTLFILSLFVMGMSGALVSAGIGSSRNKSADARRISELNQVADKLEYYFDSNRFYPSVTGGNSFDRWSDLKRKLPLDEYFDDLCVRQSNMGDIKEHQYDYNASGDGQSYVLKAIMSTPEFIVRNSELDVDGEVFSIWCGDEGKELEFCMTTKSR